MPPTPIAVAVVCRAGKFLIGRRPAGVPLAGLWEFPGGKVQADETPQAAAVRECREETGLDVTVTSAYPEVVQQYDHDRVRLFFFACELGTPQRTRPTDDPTPPTPDGYRWVTGPELRDYEFPRANAGLIAMLADQRSEVRDQTSETNG